jgi:hypothetical protein
MLRYGLYYSSGQVVMCVYRYANVRVHTYTAHSMHTCTPIHTLPICTCTQHAGICTYTPIHMPPMCTCTQHVHTYTYRPCARAHSMQECAHTYRHTARVHVHTSCTIVHMPSICLCTQHVQMYTHTGSTHVRARDKQTKHSFLITSSLGVFVFC